MRGLLGQLLGLTPLRLARQLIVLHPLRVLGACAVVAGAVVLAILFAPVSQTTGTIFVSGPQVFTRERLVNDRYREDAWLQAELDRSKNLEFGVTGQVRTDHATNLSGSFGIGTGTAPEKLSNVSADAPQVLSAATPTPAQLFDERRRYRAMLRDLEIENQLDDRHDLRGNSLYRLRFDAAVITGNNTRRSAMVSISVLPPQYLFSEAVEDKPTNGALSDEERTLSHLGSLWKLEDPQRQAWNRIYSRWLDSLNKRFDTARRGMVQAYYNGRFEAADYTALLSTMKKSLLNDAKPVVAAQERPNEVNPNLTAKNLKEIEAIKDDPKSFRQLDLISLEKISTVAGEDIQQSRDLVDKLRDIRAKLQETTFRQSAAVFGVLPSAATDPNPPPLPNPIVATPTTVVDVRCPQIRSYQLANSNIPPVYQQTLDAELDRAFENRIYNAVLGVDLNLRAFTATDPLALRHVSNLLDRLVRRVTAYGDEAQSFGFERLLRYLVVARNPIECRFGHWTEVKTAKGVSLYVMSDTLAAIKELLEDYEVMPDLDRAEAALDLVDAADPGNRTTNFVGIDVDIGLTNFVRIAGRRLDVFSYALLTSESADLVARIDTTTRNTSVGGGVGGLLGSLPATSQASRNAQEQEARTQVDRQLPVVVFAQQLSSAIPSFGWIIRPSPDIGTQDRQRPSETSLTALISLPAWWEEVRVKVTTSWTDQSNPEQGSKVSDYRVELPVNFETIDASLFDNNERGPALSLWTNESQTVEACKPAELLIRGTRLWRSTVVTLGAQRADEIFVLPNMNGVVARFNQVDPPSEGVYGKSAGEGWTTLNVWTSQGSLTPPKSVQVRPSDQKCFPVWTPRTVLPMPAPLQQTPAPASIVR